MALTSLRIIIATGKNELFNLIRSSLTTDGNLGVVINVKSLAEVENKLVRTTPNVLILDVDSGVNNPAQLQQFTFRYKILIILTGLSNNKAIPLMKGAIKDFVPQPQTTTATSYNNYITTLLTKIRLYSMQGQNQPLAPASTPMSMASMTMGNVGGGMNAIAQNQRIVAIASSTGGPEALEKVFRELPPDCPPVVVVQHMPSGFTRLFADRLNTICRITIKEAASGDYLLKGQVLIAPADYHMILIKHGARIAVDCYVGAKIHGVMPAADILFESVAAIMRQNAIGVVLTGMGADGARGLLKMHTAGAKTIGQNEKTSVVYGMPKVAFDMGAVDHQLPIEEIAGKIMQLAR